MVHKAGRYVLTAIVALALASVTFIGKTAKAAGAPGGAAYQGRDEDQPHMEAALQHLREAEEELGRATRDKGGHRSRALALARQAESEVNAGIHYDDSHGGNRH
jgi:hypothetical protein